MGRDEKMGKRGRERDDVQRLMICMQGQRCSYLKGRVDGDREASMIEKLPKNFFPLFRFSSEKSLFIST